jgi:hypothetical protein
MQRPRVACSDIRQRGTMDGLVNPVERIPAQSPADGGPHDNHRHRYTIALYLVVLILLAVPIMSVVVPPLVDYPNHLARMHILAAYTSSPELQKNYIVAWTLSPYLAMDLIVPKLAYFMSIYTAGRIFLYLCLLLFVLGTFAVHTVLHHRFSPWPAAGALFTYSYVTGLGFVNYLFGVGIWLLAFAGWIVLSRGSVRRRIAGGTLLSVAVFFCHFFAFFGYMLCVGAYELGFWLQSCGRRPGALINRGIVAFCPFIVPLIIFATVIQAERGGPTWYGSPSDKSVALFSPLLFQTVPYNLCILVALLYFPWRYGLLGEVHLASVMRVPLLAVGVAAMVMPNMLMGVWGVDFRLPVVFVFLLIGSCSWTGVPAWAAVCVSGFMVALLAIDIAMIVWAWRPVGQQFDEFRLALAAIPRGARVTAFRETSGTNPRLLHQPASIYDNLSTLAIIERDAYVPSLFKNAMMPVAAAPAWRNTHTADDSPIGLHQLIDGMLGIPDRTGMIGYLADRPRKYHYEVEFGFGARPTLPPQMERVATGTFFNLYRIKQ